VAMQIIRGEKMVWWRSAIWERELEIHESWNPVKYEGETDEGGEGV
jgi:hypothetical protein